MEQIIEKIRNIFRKEGITGMDSINHCIVFIVARMLNKEKCLKYDIDEKYTYENIMTDNEGDEIGDQELYDKIYKSGKIDCLIGQMIKKLGFNNIKFKLEGIAHIKEIMKLLGKLDTEHLSLKYDIIGTIYELHLKSGTSNSMRDLGQYYTNRQVINYMIKLCDPVMKKGQIETIIDPTMGTGGFLTMSVKYLNEKYKNKIDWSKNKNNLIGFDIDDNVKNMAVLNVLLETGELCNETIVKNDTLYNDFKLSSNETIDKVDIILANEPMGLKNIVHASCCEKVKELKIRGTKAEPLFMQLFMQSLNDGGRCAVIVPDGMLFNDSNLHTDTRKHLIENFNLKKVVSLNDDFFLNTGVKTSILFFVKDENKTSEVEFCSIKLNKGELEETSIIKVLYDDIKLNNYSLFVNKYNIQETTKIEGIEYKKLGEICDFLSKSKRQASYGKDEGKYNFYTSSIIPKKCDEADYDDKCIILGTGGNANIKYDLKFSCSADNFILKSKNNLEIKYVYYMLLTNISLLENGFSGSTIKHLSKNYVENIEIPIPSIEVQQMIVKQLDLLNDNNTLCKKQIEESKQILRDYVKCMTLWDEEKKLETEIYFEQKNKKLKASDGNNEGKYRFITSSQDKMLYRDDYEFENKHIIIGRGGNASIHLMDKFSISHDDCYVISTKNHLIEYIYYYICANKNILDDGFVGSTIKHISKSYINDIKIKVSSLEKQKEIIAYCDEIEETIKKMEKRITTNEQLMKQILDTYLKVKEPVNEEVAEVKKESDEQLDEPLEEVEEEKPKKKVVVKKTIKKKSKVESTVDV
jgi:type I restriction-modification system DNA methylase subunit